MTNKGLGSETSIRRKREVSMDEKSVTTLHSEVGKMLDWSQMHRNQGLQKRITQRMQYLKVLDTFKQR